MKDSDLLDLWLEHGMPANSSTREEAVRMLVRMRASNTELARLIDELNADAVYDDTPA